MNINCSEIAPKEILIAGLARNLSRRLNRTIAALRQATRSCSTVRFLIVESDSDDDTVSRLERLAKEIPNFDYLTLGRLREQFAIRTERLAICRNAYLDELRHNEKYRHVSHLVVSDLDGVSADLTSSAFLSCWAQPEPWNACTANQEDYYYDIWALRHRSWCPSDCWQDYERWVPLVGKRSAREMFIFSRMIHLPRSQPMVEVDSAFGGLAVYQRDAILSSRYCGVTAAGEPICEHVPLCEQMRASGNRIFINPSLINAKRTRHASSKKFFRRFRRGLLSAVVGESYSTKARAAAA